jgi:hypothetical protein
MVVELAGHLDIWTVVCWAGRLVAATVGSTGDAQVDVLAGMLVTYLDVILVVWRACASAVTWGNELAALLALVTAPVKVFALEPLMAIY